jgi:hypothetical protein
MNSDTLECPPIVPIELCGKWIAWDHARTKIVGSGATLSEAREAANKVGESRPYLTKAPHATIRFAGGAR